MTLATHTIELSLDLDCSNACMSHEAVVEFDVHEDFEDSADGYTVVSVTVQGISLLPILSVDQVRWIQSVLFQRALTLARSAAEADARNEAELERESRARGLPW